MDPISIITAAGGLLQLIPNGGKRRKVCAQLLRGDEQTVKQMAADFRVSADQKESATPGALRSYALLLEQLGAHLDAICDTLTKDDDAQ